MLFLSFLQRSLIHYGDILVSVTTPFENFLKRCEYRSRNIHHHGIYVVNLTIFLPSQNLRPQRASNKIFPYIYKLVDIVWHAWTTFIGMRQDKVDYMVHYVRPSHYISHFTQESQNFHELFLVKKAEKDFLIFWYPLDTRRKGDEIIKSFFYNLRKRDCHHQPISHTLVW